jgi:protocatechuate 3,4-dioxygenase beta subunit
VRLDRRQALLAAGSAGLLAACGGSGKKATTPAAGFDGAATCSVTPEQTEGPFYVDVDKIRSDIREGRPGALLRLALRVRGGAECAPLENAVVDIWHCDAMGVYSGVQGESGTFMRGVQVTNAEGVVEFKTIYPGWYMSRTVHIHAKVHLDNQTALTTQLYFDDSFTDDVFAAEPYSSRGERETLNDNDGLFDEGLLLTLSEESGGGYRGRMTIDVQPS